MFKTYHDDKCDGTNKTPDEVIINPQPTTGKIKKNLKWEMTTVAITWAHNKLHSQFTQKIKELWIVMIVFLGAGRIYWMIIKSESGK